MHFIHIVVTFLIVKQTNELTAMAVILVIPGAHVQKFIRPSLA